MTERQPITLTFSLKSEFWEGHKEFELSTAIAEINFENLENELVNVSADYAHVFYLYELARTELEHAEITIDFLTSNMYETFKKNFPKATETHLKHKLQAEGSLNGFKKGLADLRHKERSLYVLVKSVDKKSNELRSLSARRNAEVQSF